MADTPDLSYAIGLAPEKAIEYFKAKGYTFSWDWQDTWQEAHAKAFTVAKAMRMDVLTDIREMVQKALDEGITLAQFQKELEPKLKAKGWWGRQMVGDGAGGAQTVQLGSPRRLRTIYETNLQTAYNVGRYKEDMENVDNRPYWQYVAVMDNRTRPAHAALNGKVFRYDDPFWNTHYPPLGFRCRCRVRALTDAQAKEAGISKGKDNITWEDRLINKATGEFDKVAVYTDPFTGLKVATDPGWSYNPGKAAWFPDLDKYEYPVAKKYYADTGLTGPDFKAFFDGKLKGNFPVAVLDAKYMKEIGAKTQTVYLSDETLAKNLANHPELGLQEYQKLPDFIADANLIIEKEGQFLVFIRQEDNYYFTVVKTTQDREELYMTSFRHTNLKNIEDEKRKGRIIKNEL